MKKALICLYLAVAGLLVSPGAISYAQQSTFLPKSTISSQISSPLPPVIAEGFAAFKSGDFKAALNIWFEKSSPMMQNSVSVLSGTMQGVVIEAVGDCRGYSGIETVGVTDNSQLIFVESQHEYGALFWAFTTYKTPKGWIISDFDMNTDPTEVIPGWIMFDR